MAQDPVTITYSLKEVLGEISQKLDRQDEKFESFREDVDKKFDNVQDKFEELQKEIVEIKIGQVRLENELKGDIKRIESELKGDIKNLETEVKGIGKRLDTQEFINRSVVVGFVLALVAGTVKLFFPNFPN
ncbi:MAG: Bdr protein [Symploca sp. SIO1B1]|nr:Bdr protein [Symploca sp. SIO1B1]